MRSQPTILLRANLDSVLSTPAAALERAGFRVRTGHPSDPLGGWQADPAPDLLVNHFDPEAGAAGESDFRELAPGMPVMSLDLARIGEDALVELVSRVVGRRSLRLRRLV